MWLEDKMSIVYLDRDIPINNLAKCRKCGLVSCITVNDLSNLRCIYCKSTGLDTISVDYYKTLKKNNFSEVEFPTVSC